MSLSDSVNSGRAQLNSNLSRMRNASVESSRRNPGGRVWIERNKAIGYPFFMKAGTSVKAIFMADPEPFLTHSVIRNWEEMPDGTGFPSRDYATCTQFTLGADGSTFDPTGKPCLFCSVIGQPRLLVAGKIHVIYDQPIIKKDKTEIKVATLPILLNQEEVTQQILDAAGSDIGQGSLQGCVFRVSRTDKPKSVRTGDSWAIQTKIPKPIWDREYPAHKPKLDAIDFTKGFAPMTIDEQRAALRLHKTVADNKCQGEGYNHPEYVAYVEKLEVPDVSSTTGSPVSGWSEGGLAGAITEGSAPAPTSSAPKSLFDMTDADFDTSNVPTKETAPEKPAASPAAAKPAPAVTKTETKDTEPGSGLWT